jgi:uncharacterized repeat protein (TIGR04076 family)
LLHVLNQKPEGDAVKLEPDKRVQIKVVKSECPLMKLDSCVFLDGPMIDYAASAPVCVTALLGIYPFIMTARFGVESEKMGYKDGYHVCCPDKIVEFVVSSV